MQERASKTDSIKQKKECANLKRHFLISIKRRKEIRMKKGDKSLVELVDII